MSLPETRYKRPESVLVVVYTATGTVLLMRRTVPAQAPGSDESGRAHRGRPPAAGTRDAEFWQSVTGSMRWDETMPSQTARREVWEETGLHAGDRLRDLGLSYRFLILPPWRHRYAPGVSENLEHAFALMLPAETDITLDPREHSAYVWLPFREAAERAFSWSNRNVIARIARG